MNTKKVNFESSPFWGAVSGFGESGTLSSPVGDVEEFASPSCEAAVPMGVSCSCPGSCKGLATYIDFFSPLSLRPQHKHFKPSALISRNELKMKL